MTALFKKYLDLSAELRPHYPASLGIASDDWECVFLQFTKNIPLIIKTIYSNVSGTRRDVEPQELMDFIPGYRLIHINELYNTKNDINRIFDEWGIEDTDNVIPILANYSSDFICCVKLKDSKEGIYSFAHDEGKLVLMYDSGEAFLNTIVAFYQNNVYFLDDDGYLDYDYEKEGLIGAMLNEGTEYWEE